MAVCSIGVPAAFAAAPLNDPFASPQTITGTSFSLPGTNVEATTEDGEPDHAGVSFDFDNLNCGVTFDATCQPSVWYSWTAPSSGPFQFQVCDSSYDTTLAIYTGTAVNALTVVGSNDDENCGVSGLGSVVPFNATSGTAYRIAVAGFDAETGTFTLSDAPPPPPVDPVATTPVFTPAPIPAQAQTQKKPKKKKCKKGGKKGGGKKGGASVSKKKKCGKKGGGKKGGGKKGGKGSKRLVAG